jgi:hypothetical protein
MPPGVTVLIGTDSLPASAPAGRFLPTDERIVFAESSVREAVETIVRRQPGVVVVPERFAKSPRGAALAHRIAVDAQLQDTEVWVIGEDDMVTPLASQAAPSWLPLDKAGTRRVPRIRLRPGLTVQIDGVVAHLIDLSTMGAQVLSPAILRPNQRVRVLLPSDGDQTRASGSIAWALFEMSKGKPEPHYRAGIEFTTADPDPLLRLCLLHADEHPDAPRPQP